MSLLLIALILIDGLVTCNPQPWAAPVRAAMLAGLMLTGVLVAWRRGIRLGVIELVFVGVIGAMLVSDLYHQPGGIGISLPIIGATAFAWQRATRKVEAAAIALSGIGLAGLVVACAVLSLCGLDKPDEAWNRNVIGGVLVVLLPSVWTWQGWKRWSSFGVIALAIASTLSRGAIMGGLVALAVLIYPRALLAAPAIGAALFIWRPESALMRLIIWKNAIDQLAASPWFGVGPGNLLLSEMGRRIGIQIHAHNSILTLVAQFGFVGAALAALPLLLAKRVNLERWQVATLAGLATHSMVDDPLTWLPVVVIVGVVMGIESTVSELSHSQIT